MPHFLGRILQQDKGRLFGWSGGRMASLYTRAADRKRLAIEGMHMLANEKRKSIPSPKGKVRASEQKQK
jgi:hypothetical protein